MPNRTIVYLACGALAVGPAMGAFAASDASTAAAPPPGHADASAASVDGVVAVGHTTADAGPGSGKASANAVEVGGKPLVDGTTGGSQSGNGSSHGALLDTGATPLGQLQLTPWSASSSSGPGTGAADGDAALARVMLVDPTVFNASVLQSSSHARYDSTGSSGNATSDGAVADLGNGALTVDLLHAQSSSSGSGSSYLASINGNEIGTSKDVNGACTLAVPQLVTLSCLTATGGGPGTAASSAVGTATVADGQLPGGAIVATKSSGAKVATAPANRPKATRQSRVEGEKTTSDRANSSSSLPFTGGDVAPLAAIATLAAAAGAWMQQLGRRRRNFGRG